MEGIAIQYDDLSNSSELCFSPKTIVRESSFQSEDVKESGGMRRATEGWQRMLASENIGVTGSTIGGDRAAAILVRWRSRHFTMDKEKLDWDW